MRYLITGGSGFIGSNLIEELLKKNYQIMNVDIKAPNIESHGSLWREQDILDFPGLLAAFREFQPTHVIHLAAQADSASITSFGVAAEVKTVSKALWAQQPP